MIADEALIAVFGRKVLSRYMERAPKAEAAGELGMTDEGIFRISDVYLSCVVLILGHVWFSILKLRQKSETQHQHPPNRIPSVGHWAPPE